MALEEAIGQQWKQSMGSREGRPRVAAPSPLLPASWGSPYTLGVLYTEKYSKCNKAIKE